MTRERKTHKDQIRATMAMLRTIKTKPSSWSIVQTGDSQYRIKALFDTGHTVEEFDIYTTRGRIRNYRSLGTAIRYIYTVSPGNIQININLTETPHVKPMRDKYEMREADKLQQRVA